MMSAMSSDREFEGLVAYRFQHRPVGIGGRQESTLSTSAARRRSSRAGMGSERVRRSRPASRPATPPAPTIVWVGGGIQHFVERGGDQLGDSRLVTFVYGYRPEALRTEAGKPDLRFFVEATAEDRSAARIAGIEAGDPAPGRMFIGPTSLLLHKAVGLEAGVLFPVYQQLPTGPHESDVRVAVNLAYFFWLK